MIAREASLTEAFVTLADTLVTGFDLTEFLHSLTRTCVDVLGTAAAGILLAGPTGTLQVVGSSEERLRLLELFELQNEQGPCTDCHATGEWIHEPDLRRSTRWPTFSARAVADGFVSVDALPLRLRHTRLGALNLFRESVGGIPAADRRVAQALADVAAIGLLQQRAVRESRLVADQLQHALTSRVTIEQAKGVLTVQAEVTMSQAFDLLRGYARRTSTEVSEIAERVVRGDLAAGDLR